eukprot:12892172-Prorocentrum_lima.AAC.1
MANPTCGPAVLVRLSAHDPFVDCAWLGTSSPFPRWRGGATEPTLALLSTSRICACVFSIRTERAARISNTRIRRASRCVRASAMLC